MNARANAMKWAVLWFELLEEEGPECQMEHAERQMWLALLYWAGMPCGQ